VYITTTDTEIDRNFVVGIYLLLFVVIGLFVDSRALLPVPLFPNPEPHIAHAEQDMGSYYSIKGSIVFRDALNK